MFNFGFGFVFLDFCTNLLECVCWIGERKENKMTTAARPTWAPAKGGNEQGGTRIFGPSQKYSSRDIASHTTLKPRLVLSHILFNILVSLCCYLFREANMYESGTSGLGNVFFLDIFVFLIVLEEKHAR